MRPLVAIALAMLAWTSAGPLSWAGSWPRYTVTDLGPVDPGAVSFGLAMSDSGQIAGAAWSGSAIQAFLSSGSGPVEGLGSLAGASGSSRGQGVNSAGVVVGTSDYRSGTTRAFRAENGGMVDLGTLPGGSWSEAVAINEAGAIAGTGNRGDGRTVAFRIASDGTFEDLGLLFGGSFSQAFDINDLGQVVGLARDRWGIARAFIADDQGIRYAGTLPGGGASTATAINNDGLITGFSVDSSGSEMAFVGRPGQLAALGVLPGGRSSYGLDINQLGQVVGQVAFTGGSRAFLWTEEDGMLDLNGLIDPGSGWRLQVASAINDSGLIVGTGTYHGTTRAFLLRPVPAPPPPGSSGGSDPTGSDPTGSDPTGSDPTGSDPTGSTAVPEPGSLLLALLGGSGTLLWMGARRLNQAGRGRAATGSAKAF
ncbi:hypothetical protein [Tautonia sociabilis]|uniref:PEP-CTERM sorting domain-containing protein n=1 Tax=Tautonia sociabilis TaxID=2080755 RepID=A0A432MIZ9_9BACT|nr:hypothetical protein [Tautonia sociabilis]RUL87207.1 hypothetical protein TsocGM_13345 [Tautonia sociabilis]